MSSTYITAADPVDRAVGGASLAAGELISAAIADVDDPEVRALLQDLAEQVRVTVVRRAAEVLADEARRAKRPTQLTVPEVKAQLRGKAGGCRG